MSCRNLRGFKLPSSCGEVLGFFSFGQCCGACGAPVVVRVDCAVAWPCWSTAPVAQRIEHLTTDQKVRGSNPFGRTLMTASSLPWWVAAALFFFLRRQKGVKRQKGMRTGSWRIPLMNRSYTDQQRRRAIEVYKRTQSVPRSSCKVPHLRSSTTQST